VSPTSPPHPNPANPAPPSREVPAGRTLVAWCPDWPVLAVGADLDAPAAVLDGDGARQVVAACSPAAREAGVRRGQRLRDAQRVCPALAVFPRDPQAEARAFEPVLVAAEDVAAAVELVRPGLIALAARGPARYHGGEDRLAALLRDRIAQLSTRTGSPIGCGVGVADGVFAAGLAARRPADEPLIVPPGASAAFLAPYPVAVLDRPELADLLDRLGVRTLGALAALPVAGVASRFGPDGLLAHRLARGLDPRPPAPRRPAEDLSVLHEFDPPAGQDEPVVFAAKMLADRLHALLAAAGRACLRITVQLETVGGRESVRTWRHGDALGGTLSALAVAERVRWQLDGWRTREPAGAGGASGQEADSEADPVLLLRLTPDQLVVDTGVQQTLWGREEVPDRVGRAAERVQALLGPGGVLRLYEVGGRGPGGRIERVAWGDLPRRDATRDPAAPWPGAVPAPLPPLLPDDPYPAELCDAAGAPVAVSGRARLSGAPAVLAVGGRRLRVTGWAGPWPYDERRWNPAAARRLARLQCATEDGRAWLLLVEGGAWRVEGVYQ
jgi:protein ImuB